MTADFNYGFPFILLETILCLGTGIIYQLGVGVIFTNLAYFF